MIGWPIGPTWLAEIQQWFSLLFGGIFLLIGLIIHFREKPKSTRWWHHADEDALTFAAVGLLCSLFGLYFAFAVLLVLAALALAQLVKRMVSLA